MLNLALIKLCHIRSLKKEKKLITNDHPKTSFLTVFGSGFCIYLLSWSKFDIVTLVCRFHKRLIQSGFSHVFDVYSEPIEIA